MLNVSDKTKKTVFIVLICAVFVYFLFIIISYYASDRVGMVKLSYDVNEKNIVSTAYATYVMKPDEGNLKLSKDREMDIVYPKGVLSEPIVLSSNGNTVSEVELELSYDDNKLMADENKIILVKTNSQKGVFDKCEFTLDTEKNMVVSKVTGNGVWFLATPEAVN